VGKGGKMADIVPKLQEEIEKSFKTNCLKDRELSVILKKIESKTATFEEAHRYAQVLGENLSKTLLSVLKEENLPDGKLYYNIATRTVLPMLKNVQIDVNEIMSEIQKIFDEQANIGLNAIRPSFPEGRIKGLIDKLTARGFPEDVERWLGEPIVNNSEAFADDFIRENAKFRADAGMKATITRKAAFKCCSYCAALAGSYLYGQEPKDIYSRHEFCRCVVTYKAEKGTSQDVWSKQKWKSQPEELEKRKSLGEEQLSPRERIERLERLEKDEILQQFSSESGLTIEEIKKRTKGLSNSQIRKKMIKYLSEGEKDG
jgi:hypothetical protein